MSIYERNLGDDGLRAILDALERINYGNGLSYGHFVKKLYLPDVNVTNEGVKILARFVRNNLPHLEHVHLSHNFKATGAYKGVLRRALNARGTTMAQAGVVTLHM